MTTTELFKVLGDKIDANHENLLHLLNNIERETTKTNGTIKDHEKRITAIEVGESKHILNCPRVEDIKKIDEDIILLRKENELWRLAIRYPKIAIGIIVVSVVITISVIGYSLLQMHGLASDFKQDHLEQTEQAK